MSRERSGRELITPKPSELCGAGTIADCNPSDYATTHFIGKTPLPEGACGPAYDTSDDGPSLADRYK